MVELEKGKVIPRNCIECDAFDGEWCKYTGTCAWTNKRKRPVWCPLTGAGTYRWFPVKEYMPKLGSVVLIIDESGNYQIAQVGIWRLFIDQDPWFYVDGEYEPDVKYWTFLPEKPKEEK